jgi:hypothetical protein
MAVVIDLNDSTDAHALIQMIQTDLDALVPVPVKVEERNGTRRTNRNGIFEAALDESCVLEEAQIFEQATHASDVATTSPFVQSRNVVVRISLGGRWQAFESIEDPQQSRHIEMAHRQAKQGGTSAARGSAFDDGARNSVLSDVLNTSEQPSQSRIA